MDLAAAEKDLAKVGFLRMGVDPDINLVEEIKKLKREKNAVLLAHYYQEAVIQDIADHLGDSLALAQKAAETDADIILFAGVHFMAETAKVLNPDKKVILPDLNAGCSLAESCQYEDFKKFTTAHPDHAVVTYINCAADIKTLSDIVCTSSNAEKIIKSIPEHQPIIFAPDKNLGKYLIEKTGRDMLLWDGACMVHEAFSVEKLTKLMLENPNAKIIAHPESESYVLNIAHFIGSTSALIRYAKEDDSNKYIVATEAGIIHQLAKKAPEKQFIPAPINEDNTCACSECFYMKLNTLEKVYLCLKYEKPEILLDEDVMKNALSPIQRMLEIS